jgi:hypothetical protein
MIPLDLWEKFYLAEYELVEEPTYVHLRNLRGETYEEAKKWEEFLDVELCQLRAVQQLWDVD